ncbi:hypothetical protein SpCBS45565_g07950 [Spizellomyces sp. 'palustris']|nr:hypothetical protein SpCBS45565_g07950 [Spizellomyces sp. 'palustris']
MAKVFRINICHHTAPNNRIDRNSQHSDLHTLFKRYEDVKSVGRHKRSLIGEADSWEVRLTTPRRSLTVDVEVNVGLLQNLHYANPASFSSAFDASAVLKGRVSGQPESSVRLTAMGNDLFEGRVTFDDDDGQRKTLHIELVRSDTDLGTPQMNMIMYEDHDLLDKFRERPTCFDVPAPGGIPEGSWHSGLPSLAGRAVKNIAVNQSAIDVECRPGETICPLMLSNIPRMSIFQMAQPATVGYGRDCPVAVVADITFSKMFGNDSERTILSLFNDVDSIYTEEFNVGTPISYLYVVRNVDDPSGFGKPMTSASDLLSQLQAAVLNRRLPSFNGACLVHLMTFQDFNPTLGLAYVGRKGYAGGICSGGGYNTGISTPIYGSMLVARSTAVVTLAHELGHGMGSFVAESRQNINTLRLYKMVSMTILLVIPKNACHLRYTLTRSLARTLLSELKLVKPYIMYPSASTSSNSRKFSSCSQYSINNALNQIASCFVARNALTGLEENAAPELWYTAVIEGSLIIEKRLGRSNIKAIVSAEDQCKAAPNLPKAPPDRTYEDCPYMLPSQYSCTLACLTSQAGFEIRRMERFVAVSMINLWCVWAACAGKTTAQMFVTGYFCDAANEECPTMVTPKRPGTPCSLQGRKCGPGAEDVGCGVCGEHAFEGQCLSRNSSAAANLTTFNWADWVDPDGTQPTETSSTPSSTGRNDVRNDGLPTWARSTFIATGCVIGGAIVGAGGFFLIKKRLRLVQVDPGDKNVVMDGSSSMA